jgi:formiminoglutamase
LVQKNIVPIIIGGGQDLTYGIYLGFEKLNRPINMVAIDPKLDLGYKKNDFDAESYFGQIVLEKGKNLFNFTNIGYQTYYCTKDELNLLNKMNFDAFRLGYVRSNMHDIEPIMRDASFLSLDLKSIKQSDAPAHKFPSPNGFYSEEICQLIRYAGISDNLKCFGIFELNPEYDSNNQSAALAAQIIWYFIDGFIARKGDFPKEGTKEYTKHIVSFDNDEQNVVFYQNNYNNRWWMEVPTQGKPEKKVIVACTNDDYKLACKQELPERWLKTIQKLNFY